MRNAFPFSRLVLFFSFSCLIFLLLFSCLVPLFSCLISCLFPSRHENYRFAKTAAPPNSAPIATAAVCAGPTFGVLVALVTLCEAELIREAAELVNEAMARLSDSRSDPVAVESWDAYEERSDPASLVMELNWLWPGISVRSDERAEVTLDSIDSRGSTGFVMVAVCAYALGVSVGLAEREGEGGKCTAARVARAVVRRV